MNNRTRSLIWIALFCALTCIGSFIRIPFIPVPLTLHTFFVYLAGDFLGAQRGAISQILYLGIGLAGFPVFSNGGGIGYITQPTFGYLCGFPIAAWMIGALLVRLKSIRIDTIRYIIANGAGMLIIHTLGVIYLYISTHLILGKEISWTTAIWSGSLIFMPGEIVKALLAANSAIRLSRTFTLCEHR